MGTRYLSKRAQASEDAAADPGAVFPLWRRVDFDLHLFYCETAHFCQEPVAEACGGVS